MESKKNEKFTKDVLKYAQGMTKQDRHVWKGKAAFTKATFVTNCVGKGFFLVGG